MNNISYPASSLVSHLEVCFLHKTEEEVLVSRDRTLSGRHKVLIQAFREPPRLPSPPKVLALLRSESVLLPQRCPSPYLPPSQASAICCKAVLWKAPSSPFISAHRIHHCLSWYNGFTCLHVGCYLCWNINFLEQELSILLTFVTSVPDT